MRISHGALPAMRSGVILLFTGLCATIFGYLWVNSGGKIPLVSEDGYQVRLTLPKVDNLVFQSDVTMAGVHVGKVEDVRVVGPRADVTMQLDPQAVPLHQGAQVTVRSKTMLDETYLDLTDGHGPAIANGSSLPPSTGHPSVKLDDVLTSLDTPTRQALGATLQSSGRATAGTRPDIGRSMQGVGDLGQSGSDALKALNAQSTDLAQLTGNTNSLLRSLDTGQGRIAQVVSDSNALTKTVSANHDDLQRVMTTLPPVLNTTHEATKDLHRLTGSLAPVAANLSAASPDLSASLQQLPPTSRDLRSLLPSLSQTLDTAPNTLDRVPKFSQAANPLLNTANGSLAKLNPTLGYLQPYGPDIAAFFTNFGQYLSGADGNGNVGRVLPVFNEKSPNLPLNSQVGPLNKLNPYPRPGESNHPGERNGQQPAPVEKEAPPR